MPRNAPTAAQNFLSSVLLPLLSVFLLPVSLAAVAGCLLHDKLRSGRKGPTVNAVTADGDTEKGCVIISGGRMTKGLTLARAFKRAGWKVIGVEEEGWGELCPMRFSSSLDQFYLLPPAATSYPAYSSALLSIALAHRATLFIPVSGAGSSVEDAKAAEEMFERTKGVCRTFIQDPETMLDLHDKDRFMALVDKLGMVIPGGKMVESVEEAMAFLREEGREPRYILKCMGLDENRGDMTLYPLKGDGEGMERTEKALRGLRLGITKECPYVFQEFIPGQEWCTHASVLSGNLTSFVACPSNDMLMTYENATSTPLGRRFEEWTKTFLSRLQSDPTPSGKERRLTGHFSFDFIVSTRNGEIYPIECNARVHTAVIMLPVSRTAECYVDTSAGGRGKKGDRRILRPVEGTLPRSWLYNDLIMRYLPRVVPTHILEILHPSLPACAIDDNARKTAKPNEKARTIRVDPTLVADDWMPFLVLWHLWWPYMLITRWWQGKKWTRLNVSTGRIFEA